MRIEDFIKILDCDFFTGVPDSQLKSLCDFLMNTYGIDKKHHIIGANEGNCTAIAAGYHLSTGKIPVVYLQNSGEGNIINPVASLLNEKIYAIPTIFIIGWRGEPDMKDEPQHIFQGEITLKLLEDLDINYYVITKYTIIDELIEKYNEFKTLLKNGKQVAFVIKKDALEYDKKIIYSNKNVMKREEILKHIVRYSNEDIIISTTGKTSRELFEIREENKQSHKYDFLTVGSMGHASSIALSIAINKPDKTVWCIDGDGASLMHLGSMAVIGANNPNNFIHILINNCAHESVGGMPTVADKINFCEIAKGCGYEIIKSSDNFEELDIALETAKKSKKLCFIEVKSKIGARENLGRPTNTPSKNKELFMLNNNVIL